MIKGYTYILTNFHRTILYVGATNDIERRVLEHKAGIGGVHTSKYKIKYLLYFESFINLDDAFVREKQLKNWHRDWKWNLIKEHNPELVDLAKDWFDKTDIRSVIDGRF